MKRRTNLFLLSWLLLLIPLWGQSQTRPLVYWRFEGTRPWLDYSSDTRPVDVTQPGQATIPAQFQQWWAPILGTNGPVGDFIQNIGTGQISTAGQLDADLPISWNPDGLTVEMLLRHDEMTTTLRGAFKIMPRISFDIYATEIRLLCINDCGNNTTSIIPLNGFDRLSEGYLRDGKWHHYAFRYEFKPEIGKGEVALYIDGLTLPQMRFEVTRRLGYAGMSSITVLESSTLNRVVDADEFIIYDEAIPADLIYQHYLDFKGGKPYREVMDPQVVAPALPYNYPLVFDLDDFVPNFDPNNPPAAVLNGTSTFNQQIAGEYPLPRYAPNHGMLRNQSFTGLMAALESSLVPSGTARNESAARNVWELHNNWNYAANLGALSQVGTELANPTSILRHTLNLAPANPTYGISSSWKFGNASGAGPWVNNGLGTGMQQLVPGSQADEWYLVNDGSPNTGQYIAFNPGNATGSLTTTPGGNRIRPNARIEGATADGVYFGNFLNTLRMAPYNVNVGHIVENGEVFPSRMTIQLGQSLIPAGNNPRDNQLAAAWLASPYNTPVSVVPTSTVAWGQFVTNGKYTLDSAYREGMINASGLSPRPSFSYYQIHGNGPWEHAQDHRINQQAAPLNEAGQQYYSTPGIYFPRAYSWQATMRSAEFIRTPELPWVFGTQGNAVRTGYFPYFSPSVSPGYDEGNVGAGVGWGTETKETQMMRPGYYLGILKALGMMGAEYFIAFQYNQFSQMQERPHDAAWWGWQYAMPSYAQATYSRMEEVFKNSVLMDGNMNSYEGGGNRMKFWAGNSNYFVMARQRVTDAELVDCENFHCSGTSAPQLSNNELMPEYLITGSIQSNEADSKVNMANRELSKNVRIRLAGQDVWFEIRKQGSTYYYNRTDPNEQLFYQLDKWHEHTHPSRWTNDVVIEAELFDRQTAISPNVTYKRYTRDYLDNPISNGDFRAATTFVSLAGAPSVAGTPDMIEFRFNPRDLATGFPVVRCRAKVPVFMGIEIVAVNSGAMVYSSFGSNYSTNFTSACWIWKNFPALTLSPQDYYFRVYSLDSEFDIDQVGFVSSLTNYPGSATAPKISWAFANGGTGITCTGEEISVETTWLLGARPWTYSYTDNGVNRQVNGITDLTHSFVVRPQPTSNLVQVRVGDINCPDGIVSQATLVAKNLTPAPVALVPTLIDCQKTVPTNIAAPPGYTSYLWSNGQTTQGIPAPATAVYTVTMTDAGGCKTIGRETVSRFLPMQVTSSSTNGFVLCGGGSITLSVPIGLSNYAWTLEGSPTVLSNTNTLTVSTPGTYIVSANQLDCRLLQQVVVTNAAPRIKSLGYQCSGGPNVTLAATPLGGTWSCSPSGFLTLPNTFRPSAVPVPPGTVQTVTLTYTLPSDCHGCTNQVATYTFNVYGTCIDPCGKEGANLAVDGTFEKPSCPPGAVLPFTSLLSLDCNSPLDPDSYTVVSDENGWGSPFTPTAEHSCLANSQMIIGKVTQDSKVWMQDVTTGTGTYSFRFWARGTGNLSYEVIAGPNLIAGGPIGANWGHHGILFSGFNSTQQVSLRITGAGGDYFSLDDITINEVVNPLSITGNSSICVNNAATFRLFGASTEPATSYLWQQVAPGPVVTVGNAITATCTIPVGATSQYQYLLTATYPGGCTTTATFSVNPTQCNLKAAGDIPAESSDPQPIFTLFPNPNNGNFTLEGQLSGAKELRIRIMSMTGVTVYSKEEAVESEAYSKEIDLGHVPSGVYFLQVDGQGFKQVLRVVKQ